MTNISQFSMELLPFNPQNHHWTPGAMYCYVSEVDCGNCVNAPIMKGKCAMPRTVAALLAYGVSLPKTKKLQEACEERGVNVDLCPDLAGVERFPNLPSWQTQLDSILEQRQAALIAV